MENPGEPPAEYLELETYVPLRAQIERILGRASAKVKEGKLFNGIARQVLTNCDNSATRRLGVQPIMGNHKTWKAILPHLGEDEQAESVPQAGIQPSKRLVKQKCRRPGQ
jgi:hypothetical protein